MAVIPEHRVAQDSNARHGACSGKDSGGLRTGPFPDRRGPLADIASGAPCYPRFPDGCAAYRCGQPGNDDLAREPRIYQEDAVLEYPQSGERIRGRHNIQASRFAQPNEKRFTVRRILGAADLWITELVLTYDGQPSYTVSIMEFRDGKVVRETQYFGDPFEPGSSRVQWVERIH